MATILDKIRSGATGLFAGPMISGQQGPDPGARQGLISAGLATIIGANNGATPLEALAMGAMQGQQAGGQARQDFLNRQTREQLSQFLQENGYDRNNLTSSAFQLLAAGDMEGAKGVFNILQSLPAPTATPRVNTRIRELTGAELVRLGAAPENAVQPDQIYEIEQDPRSSALIPGTIVAKPNTEIKGTGLAPDGEWRSYVKANPTAEPIWGEIAKRDGEATAGGGAEERRRQLLGGITRKNLDLAFSDPEGLANWFTGTLARVSEGRSVASTLARGLLGRVRPTAQTAQAGRQMVMSTLTPLLSGAAMTDTEREFYGTAFTIQENDLPQTIAAKYAAVAAMTEAFAQGILEEETGYETPSELRGKQRRNAAVLRQINDETLGSGRTFNQQGPSQGGNTSVTPSAGLPDFRPGA